METKKVSPGYILFIMLMSMTAGAMCLNKVAPILTTLTQDMALASSAQAGLLISVFVFAGIFLSLPIGAIITKFGYYKTGAFALAAILVGSIIGGLNLGYNLMLVSRVIEGIGLVFLSTLGPGAVSTVFDDKTRGAAMGLLMCFMAFGQIAMLNLAPRIAASGSWTTIWWGTAVYAAIFLVLWVLTLRNLDAQLGFGAPAEGEATDGEAKAELLPKEVFSNVGLWLVGVTLMLFLVAEQGAISFLPTYLSEVRGMDAATAGSVVSIAPLVGIPVGILAGMISDKVGSRKKPLGILMLLSAVSYALMPIVPTNLYMPMIVFFGIAVMGIVGLCFSAGGELVAPQHGGMAVALLNTLQWIGIFLSSTVFGVLIDGVGWDMTFFIMVPLTVVGALCTFVAPKLK